MNQHVLLTDRLADIADAIDEGGPVEDSILFGLPLCYEDGRACAPSLLALGFYESEGAWIRNDERYIVQDSEYVTADIPLSEIDGLRITLLKRAEKLGVAVYIPESAQIAEAGLDARHHPVKKMLDQAPNLRLLFAPGANQRSELANLLSCRAVNWPQAMRISLEAHASFPVSPNAHSNLAAARDVILRETKAQDKSTLLEELAMRYGKSHSAGVETEKDEVFLKALEPYLRKAFLHE